MSTSLTFTQIIFLFIFTIYTINHTYYLFLFSFRPLQNANGIIIDPILNREIQYLLLKDFPSFFLFIAFYRLFFHHCKDMPPAHSPMPPLFNLWSKMTKSLSLLVYPFISPLYHLIYHSKQVYLLQNKRLEHSMPHSKVWLIINVPTAIAVSSLSPSWVPLKHSVLTSPSLSGNTTWLSPPESGLLCILPF